MKIIVCGDVAFKESTFFENVRMVLDEEGGLFDGTAEGDDILDAFGDFIDQEYSPSEVYKWELDDKIEAQDRFIEEIFSWLSDDYREVELKED